MSHYRIYLLNSRGHFASAVDCTAASDEEALSAALAKGHPHGFEVWQGTRRVAIEASPTIRPAVAG